ncbi:hypothetical protein C8A00DRAFT_29836 [Chaetomidium leptoderma]|uniref:Uncharacterized protein n=1 Tax=Chaetomidium leptoderma TaxID=669021 RepID=A0AAN6VTR1_9PEZI|nr:hypothetical protein C8A00DRAFT_29836 [Chaetomidium leptoderma]
MATETQEHLLTQWTALQSKLVTLTFPKIGSICRYSKKTGTFIGPLALDGLPCFASLAAILEGTPSRIYGIVERGGVFDGMEEMLTRELVRLGYGLTGDAAKKLLELEAEMKVLYPDMLRWGLRCR